jgi:hypothetical protein
MVAPNIPDWVQEVTWIKWRQLPKKQVDISEKYKALSGFGIMTDNVIVMDDDFYIVKKTRSVPLMYNMPMRAKAITRPQDDMGDMLRYTLRLLLQNRIGVPLAAVLHVPFPITRSNLPVHLEDGRGPYEWKTIYLNWAMQQGVYGKSVVLDPKIIELKDVPIALEHNVGFISSVERTYNEVGMEEILNNFFPDKCSYERG